MKTGLVMEGGAMRGLYTAGVIDVMMEMPLPMMALSAYRLVLSLAVIINLVRLAGSVGIICAFAGINDIVVCVLF